MARLADLANFGRRKINGLQRRCGQQSVVPTIGSESHYWPLRPRNCPLLTTAWVSDRVVAYKTQAQVRRRRADGASATGRIADEVEHCGDVLASDDIGGAVHGIATC